MRRSLPLLISLFIFSASTAAAENVVGILRRATPGGTCELAVLGSEASLRIEADLATTETLNNLRAGTLIVGTGQVRSTEGKVHLDAVQSVGLQELIGTWRSSRREIFEFRGFNQLIQYFPTFQSTAENEFSVAHIEKFEYVLTPENRDTFSIFITDAHRHLIVGTLHLVGRRLMLTVYDSETGHESEKISLSPLSLK